MRKKLMALLLISSSLVIGGAGSVLAATSRHATVNPCPNTFCQLQDPNTIVCVYGEGWTCSFISPDDCSTTHC
jgi:hypothetical protein